jgi:cytochrome P450
MYFTPVIGSFNKDLRNASEKGDYYYDYNELAKTDPRPKAIGKNLGPDAQLYLIDPEAIRQFFINHEEYIKHPKLNGITRILSRDGLVMAEGRIWRKHRKLISGAFQFDMLKELVPDVLKHSKELVDAAAHKDMRNVDALAFFKATAGEVIGRIFFEESLGKYTMQGMPMTLFLAEILSRITSEPYNSLYLMFGMPLVQTKLVPR